jgi:hypothetical protein
MSQSKSFSLAQLEGETDADYKHRIYRDVAIWVPDVIESDIPEEGPVRTVWNNVLAIRAMTDDELAEAYFDMLEREEALAGGWWGVIARSRLEIFRMEREFRYDLRM